MTKEGMDRPQLVFQSSIGRQKPNTVRPDEPADLCPFCDRSLLPPIIKEDGDILLVPNKYPILQNSDPFVIIETAECESELSLYDEGRLLRVFRMAFDAWRGMLNDKRYRSVMFLKNHGPLSGGSLRHPHMQLIGLHDVDFRLLLNDRIFYGPVIHAVSGAQLNISDSPRIGFVEFNAILTDQQSFDAFCLMIQKAVQYILRDFHNGQIASYNLFFYDMSGAVFCKVMPRYATTPVFMGYGIPQVVDNLDVIAEECRKHCFSE